MSLINRRQALALIASASVLGACVVRSGGLPANRVERTGLRTKVCQLLGIEYPIVQAGMGGVAGADLAAEVSRAGGLGTFAASWLTADQVREGIRTIRARTDRPFAVNLLMPPELRDDPPAAPEAARVAGVYEVANLMRAEAGIPRRTGAPGMPTQFVAEALEVILEERPPIFAAAMGNPGADVVNACHERGIRVMAMVTNLTDARALEQIGVDLLVAQGWEAGGHRSHLSHPRSAQSGAIGTFVLVAELADAMKIPVIAAGGITDGRGVIAALTLGADGVLLGTRFMATRESLVNEIHKRALVERTGDDTIVTDTVTGRWSRVVKNEFTERFAEAGVPPLPYPLQLTAVSDILRKAIQEQDPRYMPMWAGQGVSNIHDLPGAAEVVARLVRESREALDRMRTLSS